MGRKITQMMKRRQFVKQASFASTALAIPKYLTSDGADQKLKVGLIGAGWYGMVIAEAGLEVGGIEVIGVCDVDSNHLTKSVQKLTKIQGTEPKGFQNYRELLEMPDIEGVLIGTPPHWHALQFIDACKKGLHIYCEKPLAYDVDEGLAMVRAAKEADNFVQIGFQRRKAESFHRVSDMIADDKLGKVHEIKAQIHYNPNLQDATPQPAPGGLDWEAWCGPAPMLKYRPSIGHKAWRLEREYGNGHLVDWGIHHIDATRMMLGLGMANRFETHGSLDILRGKITTPDTLHATMFFDECPIIWEHRLWGTGTMDKRFRNGIFVYGEKATVFVSDRNLMIMSNRKGAELEKIEVSAKTIRQDMMADFIHAVQKQDKSLISGPVDEAYMSTACVQLAMASYYSGSNVIWNEEQGKIVDNDAASKLLARPYREGYTRPE